jgi:hypothetical protein
VHLQKLTNLKESQANLKKEKNRKKKWKLKIAKRNKSKKK